MLRILLTYYFVLYSYILYIFLDYLYFILQIAPIKQIELQQYQSIFIYIQQNIQKYTNMSISHFAQTINHPICQYMDTLKLSSGNSNKDKIYFLSGDPTVYGNNDFKMPELGYQLLRKQIQKPQSHGYTLSSGIPSARQAVLKLYKPKNKVTIQNVVIQHGVNQGLLAALMAFTNPGDQILIPQIGYPIFDKLAPALQVKPITYKLKPQNNYQIDLQHVSTVISQRTQFIFIINPSNPMGTVFTLQHMQQILQFCDKHELPIVSDQVYHGQVFQQNSYYSFGDVTDNVPVLVLSGVQKILSVPGWSTSWTVLFDKHNYLVDVWKNVLTTGMIFLHTNKFTQQALPNILDKVGLFTQKPICNTKLIHDKLFDTFNKMKGYKAIKANGTFYMTILIDVSNFNGIKNDKQYVQKLLQQQNIALLPLSIFVSGGQQNGFRLLTCAKPQVYDELLNRIKQFNSKHQTHHHHHGHAHTHQHKHNHGHHHHH